MHPILWPQQRNPAEAAFEHAPRLKDAWTFSSQRLAFVCDLLDEKSLPAEVAAVAASGSLSRMEAHSRSDLDLLIVVDDRRSAIDTRREQQIASDVWSRLKDSGFQLPRTGGIFSKCARWSELVDEASRGIVDADLTTFGQRMQLLADAQPLARHDQFVELQDQILAWYSENRIAALFGEAGTFHWLWQDVQRYWRSLRSRSSWLYLDDRPKAMEINLKLRSSRLVIVAAFLRAISDAHCNADSPEIQRQHLAHSLRLTPLERLAANAESYTRRRLISAYETAWSHITDAPAEWQTATSIPPAIDHALRELRTAVLDCLPSSQDDSDRSGWIF
ncbi:MAG: nucleotidyltransferase domain-containing protein [Planctomycetaceae bacterium]